MSRLALRIDSIERVDEDLKERIREAAMDVRLECARHINALIEHIEVDGPPLERADVIHLLVELWGAIMDDESRGEPDWIPLPKANSA